MVFFGVNRVGVAPEHDYVINARVKAKSAGAVGVAVVPLKGDGAGVENDLVYREALAEPATGGCYSLGEADEGKASRGRNLEGCEPIVQVGQMVGNVS